jgi:hypothetical protein
MFFIVVSGVAPEHVTHYYLWQHVREVSLSHADSVVRITFVNGDQDVLEVAPEVFAHLELQFMPPKKQK